LKVGKCYRHEEFEEKVRENDDESNHLQRGIQELQEIVKNVLLDFDRENFQIQKLQRILDVQKKNLQFGSENDGYEHLNTLPSNMLWQVFSEPDP